MAVLSDEWHEKSHILPIFWHNPPSFTTILATRHIHMTRICQVTGKRSMSGNNVSHAHNKTRRKFLPNLHYRRFWVDSENRWVRLRISAAGLRIIDKKGIDAVLSEIRARGDRV